MTAASGRALVTGAAGFVGSWLCRRLIDEGYAVTGTVRHRPQTGSLFARLGLDGPVASVPDPEGGLEVLIGQCRPDLVFNLAGQAEVRAALADPGRSFEVNAGFVWRLLDAVRAAAPTARIIHASSEAIYGEAGAEPSTEDSPFRATGPYESSKAAGDIVARSYAATFGLHLVVARLGNVYGPCDSHQSRLIPDLFRSLRAGRAPVLRTATAVRSFIHVDDVTEALLLLASHAGDDGVRGQAFNVSCADGHTTLEVARLASAAFGRPDLEPIVEGSAAREVSVMRGSPARIAARLGWRARIALPDGLEQVAKHPLENGR
jgi:nucleoside-diphosphate-sugar epimerase